MSYCIVLGTRPEIIKMAPIIRECQLRRSDFFIIHTGQHYSYEMDKVFFKDLELPEADHNLNVGSGSHGQQTAAILKDIEDVLVERTPSHVLVQGDTNTVLAGALAAAKLHIRIAHIEAGLRSFDRRMPEEINRIMADHVSDILLAPTEVSKANLLAEGIPAKKIFVTGNTVVDAVRQNADISRRRPSILARFGLHKGGYLLATMHRAENVDSVEALKGMIEGIELVCRELSLPALLPLHPRTKKNLDTFGIRLPQQIIVTDPVGYLDFLQLESQARLCLSDSGGVQEEACIMGVPCITLRDSTERPETVQVGANIIAGTRPENILASAMKMMNGSGWSCPLGDGHAAERILDILDQDS